jgi:uncharacterized UPF0160 family protein
MTREEIHSLVEVFYHPTFKTFYINSLDEKSFVHPIGVFVSLGITTSMKVLNDIKEIIGAHDGYSTIIAEISSKQIAGQYLNTVIKTSNISQYVLTEFDQNIMTRSQAIEELDNLKKSMNLENDLEILKDITPKISKLSDLISRLDKQSSWENHLIQKENDDYRIFHKLVNYKKENDIEYRIGIYVTES